MIIATKEISINVVSESNLIPKNKTPILFLHGFTGSAEDWKFIFPSLNQKYFPIAIDLPGHGKTKLPNKIEYYSTEGYVNIVQTVIDYFNISELIIVGYSMGGRTALSFANKNPRIVKALILESSTAGIENKAERELRIKTDSDIAKKILNNGMEYFVQYWLDLPFFRSLKSLDEASYSKLIKQKKQNSEEGLSNSLLGFSTGKMPNLWEQLNELNNQVLLIAGSLDRKYVRLNKKMNRLFPNSELKTIEDCGHNTHLENKREFTILVNKFLNNLE
jgi:2-succinyl-6-hydroxy-2,4-cyclohexadiene-1-carboxylate synthase